MVSKERWSLFQLLIYEALSCGQCIAAKNNLGYIWLNLFDAKLILSEEVLSIPNAPLLPPERFPNKMGSAESHFIMTLIMKGKITKTISINYNL